jgi:REP element-mobilizing transposase RayT
VARPRHGRLDAEGVLHHIIVRGIERRLIFRDDIDKARFVERMEKAFVDTRTPCYAWALLGNHAHLLLKTGTVPLHTVMARLLTGHAVVFNKRHHRHGQLFQNRYKSILCQEDTYLIELVSYIHLNPIRAGIIKNLSNLSRCSYSGHAARMGRALNSWQDVDYVLRHFNAGAETARHDYLSFMQSRLTRGKRPDLTGVPMPRRWDIGSFQCVTKGLDPSVRHRVHTFRGRLGDDKKTIFSYGLPRLLLEQAQRWVYTEGR